MKKARKWLLYELFSVFGIEPGSGKGKFIEHLTDLLELIERVKNSYDELICGEQNQGLKNRRKGRRL